MKKHNMGICSMSKALMEINDILKKNNTLELEEVYEVTWSNKLNGNIFTVTISKIEKEIKIDEDGVRWMRIYGDEGNEAKTMEI